MFTAVHIVMVLLAGNKFSLIIILEGLQFHCLCFYLLEEFSVPFSRSKILKESSVPFSRFKKFSAIFVTLLFCLLLLHSAVEELILIIHVCGPFSVLGK